MAPSGTARSMLHVYEDGVQGTKGWECMVGQVYSTTLLYPVHTTLQLDHAIMQLE